MIRIHEILDKVSYLPAEDRALIQKAYVFSAAAHAGQMRLSGEPYLSHPLEVANKLAEMRLDAATIAAGLLHDTVEDTKAEVEEIDSQFGEDVADIVDGVTKISQMQMSFDSKEARQAENLRKMIMAMSEDIRVLLVKLCDRMHNMRTLDFQKSHKQKLIAQETMDIYAPLANRLGLHLLKIELEDISLKYLRPDVYNQIGDGLKDYAEQGKEYIDKVKDLVQKKLKKHKITAQVSGRVKHVYSTWRKMEQQGLTLDQVHDLIAFRIVVESIKDCYSVLGLMHADYKPVPGRFKDYISMPKANMYQSLHTTVVGPDGERIEIQIRTEEMHKLAEFGVAAHWSYKEKGSKTVSRDLERFSWLREMMDWQKEESDPGEFMKSLRFDLFKDEVYVFTPNGDVRELPEGATAVDFAYLIHSEVGDRCAGARVNGRLVPLSRKLKNGDMIEIITDKKRSPSRDWLKFVKTAKARTRINHFIRTEERSRAMVLGREMLEKEGRRMSINVAKGLKAGDFDEISRHFSFKDTDELLASIGYARLTPRQVLNRLVPKLEESERAEVRGRHKKSTEKEKEARPTEKVSIKGVDDVLVRFAQCCNPVPGDAIIGYISRGRGVTVHTTDCPNVGTMEPERLLNVAWEGEQEDRTYTAKIRVVCKNVQGMLMLIAGALDKLEVNIDSGSFQSNVDGNSEIIMKVDVRDSDHLYQAVKRLSDIKNVIEVTRVTSKKDE
ncbi:RelA/SpoT family protein [Desulfovibrio ferrophilus]|uniref:(P)ppGpp synthetase I SpoT/RelA n=1 Tax=Desulfovibrio ferrophilus TaxID=241368 RepID=A0A2Z6AXW5_9BACT|nr:bifunctional (p)ppGpp synthetase/guanosine-3',5'-bis(diphosphate) 3'-pyrophosphohydrolase [Desulfovibrio ferrophilus]BBD08045.1 (p)ppGpp synthetase I SpoT/RelA [Desulfovibrio ferrophilus]